MDRLGLNLDGMAAQLEISLRQVAAFRGSKPIPNHMALAILHLDQVVCLEFCKFAKRGGHGRLVMFNVT
jgi:hypothetical protein